MPRISNNAECLAGRVFELVLLDRPHDWAGLGVAMGQASGSVKQSARWSASSIDEDGAAVAIEKFVLGGRAVQHLSQTLARSPFPRFAREG